MAWKTPKEGYFLTQENYEKFKFQCPSIKSYWHSTTPTCFYLVYGCFCAPVSELSSWPRRYWVPWLWDGFTAAHPAICFIYSILLSVHRHHVKTGKVDFECHTFYAWWGADYYFIELHGRALCFLWTVLIKYSIYWHHSNPSSQKKNETISSNTSHHSRISSQNKKTENRIQSK